MKQRHKPLIVGHCGARGLAPDNTIASFQAAIDNGADMIETDLQLTGDGHIVLLHHLEDPKRPGLNLPIQEKSLAEIRRIKPDTATLAELLTLVNHRCALMLEIKDRGVVPSLLETVDNALKQGWKVSDFLISSFDLPSLKQVRQARPAFPLAVIETWSGIRAVKRARQLGTTYICMNQAYLWSGFVRHMAKRYRLFSYTPQFGLSLNKHRKAARWIRHGLYGIITDYPNYYRSNDTV